MKKLAVMIAASFLVLGCGSSSVTPSVSQVTVIVTSNGVPQADVPIVESADWSDQQVPIGVLDTKSTNASGQAVFSVPSSTSTDNLCFSISMLWGGGMLHFAQCRMLNDLPATMEFQL